MSRNSDKFELVNRFVMIEPIVNTTKRESGFEENTKAQKAYRYVTGKVVKSFIDPDTGEQKIKPGSEVVYDSAREERFLTHEGKEAIMINYPFIALIY